jgi:drug/metabolite transporter (DMT)-like permease
MSPRDHNKTLVVLYSLVCGFLALLLCASPWIIAKNVSSTPSPRRDDQIMTAAIVMGIVIFLFLLFLFTAIGLHRQRQWGRTLALCAAVLWLFYFPPVAVYSWWFLHSENGKQHYGIASPSN